MAIGGLVSCYRGICDVKVLNPRMTTGGAAETLDTDSGHPLYPPLLRGSSEVIGGSVVTGTPRDTLPGKRLSRRPDLRHPFL